MSNLSQNVKKYFMTKLVDIIEIILFIYILFWVVPNFALTKWYLFATAVLTLLLFLLVQHLTDLVFGEWGVPDMEIGELKNYNIIDSFYGLFICIVAVSLGVYYLKIDLKVWLTIFGFIFLVKELLKWRKFKKEARIDLNLINEVDKDGN